MQGTLSEIKSHLSHRRSCGVKGNDKRRFLYYCLYAFGLPTLVTFLLFLADHYTIFPEEYRIGIGETNCFINNDTMGIYLIRPISIVLLLNISLYSITAYKIYQVQKEFSVIQKGDSERHSKINLNKARYVNFQFLLLDFKRFFLRFFLYLRLFIIMGVFWIFTVISFEAKNSYVLHVFDILNCLQGPLIFFFFIWKPNIKKMIINK